LERFVLKTHLDDLLSSKYLVRILAIQYFEEFKEYN